MSSLKISFPTGTILYIKNGPSIKEELHRTNGPAVMRLDGTQEWWVDGYRCRSNNSYQYWTKLSDEDMLMITLKYGDVK